MNREGGEEGTENGVSSHRGREAQEHRSSGGHSCLVVIMAAVAPKSLLREVRSSPHCGSVRDQTSVMRSPTALAVRPIPWHMSIHDRDYLWTAHGHSCLVIMAAVAPKSLLREVRSSPHCGSVRDRRQRQRQQQH